MENQVYKYPIPGLTFGLELELNFIVEVCRGTVRGLSI